MRNASTLRTRTLLLTTTILALGSPVFALDSIWDYFELRGAIRELSHQWPWGARSEYSFEATGDRAFVEWYDGEGRATGSAIYAFNSTESKVTLAEFTATGSLDGTWTYRFDGQGRLIEHTVNRPMVNRVETTVFSSDGRSSETITRGQTDSTAEYDESGRKVREVFFRDGRPVRSEVWQYGDHGLVAEEAAFDASGAETSRTMYEYVLDNEGNWTERIAYDWVPSLGRFARDGEKTIRSQRYF